MTRLALILTVVLSLKAFDREVCVDYGGQECLFTYRYEYALDGTWPVWRGLEVGIRHRMWSVAASSGGLHGSPMTGDFGAGAQYSAGRISLGLWGTSRHLFVRGAEGIPGSDRGAYNYLEIKGVW
jgi:hypothetical protein